MIKRASVLGLVSALTLPWAGKAQEAPAPEPIEKLDPFQQALTRAKEEHKYLLVAVYDADCEECDLFEKDTFRNPEVMEWIDQHATVLRLDTSQSVGKNFADAHRVRYRPTVMIMSSDGRELGRQVGHIPAGRFLGKLNAVVKRSAALRGEGGLKPWAGQDVVLDTIRSAGELATAGQHDKSLELYMWCLDHRAIQSPVFVVTHLPQLVNGFAKLGEIHPPADREFRNALAMAEHNALRTNRADVFSLYLVKYMNLALGQETELVEFYDRMKRRWPRSVGVDAFAKLIYESLLVARRYQELKFSVEDPGHVDSFIAQTLRNMRGRQEAIRLLACRYEVLLGIGEEREARGVANKILGFNKSSEAYILLSEAALRSGHSPQDHLEYARKAETMTGGKNPRAILVLVRLMGQHGDTYPEAMQMIKKAIRETESEVDRKAYEECLGELRTGKISHGPPLVTRRSPG